CHKFLNGIPTKHRERVLSSISVNLPLAIAANLIPDESYWKRRATAHFKNCDPSNASVNRAIGNGIGGFGGGLMGIAPLVGPTKGAPVQNDIPKIGLAEYPVKSLEDIWMGFGAALAPETSAAPNIAPAATADSLGIGSLSRQLSGLDQNAIRQSTINPTSSGEKPSSKGEKYIKPNAVDAGRWKTLFFELHIQNLVEAMSPKKIGGLEEIAELQRELRFAAPFLRRLDIRQLKPTEPLEGEIVKSTDPPSDHMDVTLLVGELVYLRDLKIYYGVRDCGINFSWKLFGMTLNDCLNLCNAIKLTSSLETLVIQASGIDDDRARLISSALLENKTIKKLDLSHNKIGDSGARGIAKVLASPTCLLTHLDISNNQIKQEGAHSIGKALQINSTLIHLNLRMNRLGDAGGADFCMCLAKTVALSPNYKPPPPPAPMPIIEGELPVIKKAPSPFVPSNLCSLDMASNALGMETVQALCVLLKKGGKNLKYLDFSCNKLGDGTPKTPGGSVLPGGKPQAGARPEKEQDLAGKMLFEAVSQNKYITHFDIRVTELSNEHMIAIKGIIAENCAQ
ncbi:T-complex-associated testis-expressed protein 1, partial [Rhizoclosmatium hyalinum]